MVNIKDYNRLWGALDCRFAYEDEQDDPKMLFFSDMTNIEINNGLLQKMNGNVNILNTPIIGGILGITEYELNDTKHLCFNGGDGKFYLYNSGGNYTAKKTGLSTIAKCQYTQYLNKLAVCNGIDEIFIYDYTTDSIIETNFTSQALGSPKGYCCAAYQGRLWVADGYTLYYSDLGNPTEWRNIPGNTPPILGGFIANFMSNTDKITGLFNYGEYLAIFTTNHSYLLAGSSPSDFAIKPFGNVGVPSRFGMVIHNRNGYFFNNLNIGVYFMGQLTDLGQIRIGDAVTRRIYPLLAETLDLSRLDQIVMVPYVNRNQVWMYVPEQNKPDLSICYVFDFNYATPNSIYPDFISIFKRVGLPVTCSCKWNNNVFTGDSNGNIYQEDINNNFNGNYIPFSLSSPIMSLGSRSTLKRAEYIKLWCNNERVNSFNVTLRYNRNLTKKNIKKVSLIGTGIWDDDNTFWDDSCWADDSEVSKLINISREFYSVQIGVEGNQDSDQGHDISLRAFSIMDFQQLNDY